MSDADKNLVMDEPAARDVLAEERHGTVGQGVGRVDGPAKVSGAARYAYEEPVDGVAYGYVLTAEIGRGWITSVDPGQAEALAGVLAVIAEPELVPTDSTGGFDGDELPRTLPQIENYGQVIGMVVAESFETAREAAKRVAVSYETEPGRYEMVPHLAEAEPDPPNQLAPNQDKGDLDATFASAAVTLDETYTTPPHLPAALEPHAAIARWDGDMLEIRASLQMLKGARRIMAASLGIGLEKVRILSPYIGGGFGGKTGVGPEAVLAAIAARRLRRPVKIALTRRQTAHAVHRRSETRQRMRIACDKDGNILGIGHESHVAQKPTRNFIEPVSFGSFVLYKGEARRFNQSVVRLDLPNASPVRAPGEAVGMLALECAMDEMAEKLGLDPIAFRKRNEPERDPLRDVPFSTRRLVECYDEGASRSGWERRDPQPGAVRDGEWLIGMGMAAATRKNLLNEGEARVRLTAAGRAVVESDQTDIGTGTYTILSQVAGEMLGLSADQVEVRLGDTNLPPGAGSGGSFGAASSSSATLLACQEIVSRLARLMQAEPDELRLQDGMATARNRRVPIPELLRGQDMEAVGRIAQGSNALSYTQVAYGAQFAEVAVNAVSGEVRLRRMLGIFDCGRILNRATARSQAIGGMIWGVSYALHEDAVVDPRTGGFVTRDLADYHIPVNADLGWMEADFIEEPDLVANPVGVKGIGELGISGAGAAVANAVYNACGVRIRDFPLTLDKILPGLPPV